VSPLPILRARGPG